MSVTPEQKMKLMLELGMEDAAAAWAEVHNLTTMKFRPITEDKIEELLAVEYQEMQRAHHDHIFAGAVAGALLGAIPSSFIGMAFHATQGWYAVAVCVVIGTVWGYIDSRPKMVTHTAEVCNMPLQDWDDNLPYGALLSVKEAKAQGFKNFTIFFPAKDDSRYAEIKRLKADPIIVAHKKGHGDKMYNIFAWDDSKIYE